MSTWVTQSNVGKRGVRLVGYALSFHIKDSGLTCCAVSPSVPRTRTGTGEMGLRGLRGIWGASKACAEMTSMLVLPYLVMCLIT